MPIYAMSCFKLPKTTCQNLNSAMSQFWWQSFEHARKMNWVSWEKLCLPKDLGGLRFKDIERFNQALLAKQAWRIRNCPDSLLARLLKSRYFHDYVFLRAETGVKPSLGWKSVLHGRDLLEKGISRRIGDGHNSFVWTDPWMEDSDGPMRAP